jgi:low affinity Fe/Cu permease
VANTVVESIDTATTIVTFLMVSLLQNSQTLADAAVQDKRNAIATALADATDELRHAVGLEDRESS